MLFYFSLSPWLSRRLPGFRHIHNTKVRMAPWLVNIVNEIDFEKKSLDGESGCIACHGAEDCRKVKCSSFPLMTD